MFKRIMIAVTGVLALAAGSVSTAAANEATVAAENLTLYSLVAQQGISEAVEATATCKQTTLPTGMALSAALIDTAITVALYESLEKCNSDDRITTLNANFPADNGVGWPAGGAKYYKKL